MSADTEDGEDVDVSEELMNLARHHMAEAREIGPEPESEGMAARMDTLLGTADQLNQMSRWLAGERDRPAFLAHGEELKSGNGEGGDDSGA